MKRQKLASEDLAAEKGMELVATASCQSCFHVSQCADLSSTIAVSTIKGYLEDMECEECVKGREASSLSGL